MKSSWILLSIALIALPVWASEPSTIEIGTPWSRATSGRTGVVYLSLTNHGALEDRLLAVATPAADVASIHETVMHGDHMSMEEVEALVLPPGEKVELRPNGLHIMLMGLEAPLVKGASFALKLRFEQAGEREVRVRIEGPGARKPSMNHDHH